MPVGFPFLGREWITSKTGSEFWELWKGITSKTGRKPYGKILRGNPSGSGGRKGRELRNNINFVRYTQVVLMYLDAVFGLACFPLAALLFFAAAAAAVADFGLAGPP